jgi:secreted trypsin-like serine protease
VPACLKLHWRGADAWGGASVSRDLPIPNFVPRLLVWAVALGALLCAAPAHAVVGGFRAGDGEYPWAASIVVAGQPAVGDNPHFCGGTVIATNRVLTAAHCVDPGGREQLTPSSVEVIVGQTSLCAGAAISPVCPASDVNVNGNALTPYATGRRLAVSAISLHPLADVDHYYGDVAILTLAGTVDPSEVMPVVSEAGANAVSDTTPATADAWGADTPMYVLGWGTVCWSGSQCGQSNVLRWSGGSSGANALLPRQTDAYCASAYGSAFRSSDMLCAGATTGAGSVPDSCRGDSGGPLLKLADNSKDGPTTATTASLWRLVGVVSWGPDGCGVAGQPGVYARLGSAALSGYVADPAPPSMPAPAAAPAGPSITGSYQAGGEITCNAGTWTGATSFSFKLWKDNDGDGEQDNASTYWWTDATTEPTLTGIMTSATTASYKVTSSDLIATRRASIGCQVVARGPGGYFAAATPVMSDTSVHSVPASVATTPAVSTTPAPTVASVADTTPPLISKGSSVCSVKTCRVALFVVDRGSATTTAGLQTVTFQLYLHRASSCATKTAARKAGRRSCVKTVVKVVRAKQSADQYVLQLGRLKRAERPKLRAVASDNAGNTSILSMALPLRPAGR